MKNFHITPICILLCIFTAIAVHAEEKVSLWPDSSVESKPGAYWWWPGSAVDHDGIRWNIRQAAENGMGTLHIIPIYGVKDNEANDISFMSTKWLETMKTAVEEGEKHGINIDMTLGTGWCFGGSGVRDEDSCTVASFKRETDDDISVTLRRKAIMVKRAAPGGEGPMLDPFSQRAMIDYLKWFDERLKNYDGPMPRTFYHDSYEYRANWSDELYDAFEALNGYRLQDHLDVFLYKEGSDDTQRDRVCRVKADYRRTLAEMHLAFTERWTDWAKKHRCISRNEAHGSPTNWLDVYAATDVPETEFFRNDKSPLVAKFASSAAHVAGRPFVSSESGTWADEHFHERLGTLKVLFDGFFLSGINHLFYHGMIYSPENAVWPGWSFYASTQMNPRNPIWRDAKYLNEYIARVQSVLQSGKPDNDILLLWSPEEIWHRSKGDVINFSVHNAGDWFENSTTGVIAKELWDAGLTFDYISPRQLKSLRVENGRIVASGSEYAVLIAPHLLYMDEQTLADLVDLSKKGAEVRFDKQLPKDVPGFARLEERRKKLDDLKKSAPKPIESDLIKHLCETLNMPSSSETPYLGSTGLKTISRRLDDGRYYFVANIDRRFDYSPKNPIDKVARYFRLSKPAKEIVFLDPMTGYSGKAQWRTDKESGLPEVRLQLRPNQSLIIRAYDDKRNLEIDEWNYYDNSDHKSTTITGPWKIEFLSGGPEIPNTLALSELKSWTESDDIYESFSGTARYSTSFDCPETELGKSTKRLNLGRVCESARIKLNNTDLGCIFCEPMVVDFPDTLLKEKGNVLEIEVTNLGANRIRYLDKNDIQWKIFKDINIVDIDYKPLDASKWPIQPSGLIGPVTLE